MRFLDVTINGAGQVLRMVSLEPHSLSVVRTLATDLEKEILFGVESVVGAGSKADLVVLVVLFDKVLNNCAGLPQSQVGVGVVDSGDTSIRVDCDIVWSLGLKNWNIDNLVGETQFFKDNGDLGRVGPVLTPDFDWLEIRHDFYCVDFFEMKLFERCKSEALALVEIESYNDFILNDVTAGLYIHTRVAN